MYKISNADRKSLIDLLPLLRESEMGHAQVIRLARLAIKRLMRKSPM